MLQTFTALSSGHKKMGCWKVRRQLHLTCGTPLPPTIALTSYQLQ